MSRAITVVVAVFLAVPALGQPGVQPPAPPKPIPTLVQPPPPHESLVKRDGAGKVNRVDGCLEALALEKSPLVDDAARQRMAPAVQDWTADINQLAIDNVDFLEKLDAGLLDEYDPADVAKARMVQTILNQLASAGSLASRLVQKGAIDQRQAQLAMQMSNEYLQAVASELNVMASSGTDQSAAAMAARQQGAASAVNKWYQSLSCRDVREQYRRILVDSASLVERILPSLGSPIPGKAAAKVMAIKAAQSDLDKLVAVRSLLDELPFEQRRAYLEKAVSLGAGPDPFHPAPAFPAKQRG